MSRVEDAKAWVSNNLPKAYSMENDCYSILLALSTIDSFAQAWGNYPSSRENKDKIYYSFAALNHDIRERIRELAQRPFKHRKGSRESIFNALDKHCLRPLPKERFESFNTKVINKVPNNYHVEYDGFYYSVPYQYYTKSVIQQYRLNFL